MIWLWLIVLALAVLAAHLWRVDYQETHASRARWQTWGTAPSYAMAVGRHRA